MYKAFLNNDIFFSSGSGMDEQKLTQAKLDLTAGAAGSFSFTVPPCNSMYGQFHKITDFVDVYRDDDLIFSGRVYSIEETFDTQHKIVCEGLLAVLNDSVFRPVLHDGTLHDLVRDMIDSHNSQVEASKQIRIGTLYITDAACYRDYQNYETTISRLQDLVQSFGGWMQVRKTGGNLYFDWYDHNRDGVDQTIDFGENLLDITQEEDSDGIITVLFPLGASDDNGNRVNIKTVNDGLDYITASQEYINEYGYVAGVKTWDDVNFPAILLSKAQTYLAACLTPRRTITVTAVDLADTGLDADSFRVGQVIMVNSAPHGIDGEEFDCCSQSLDLLNPANNKLTLGSEKAGYIRSARNQSAETERALERIVARYATKTYLELAQDHLTDVLTGNEGGFMIQRDTDNDGLVDEILFMDTTDVDTARNVWRINQSGWGHSSTGIDGPYTMGATLDDVFTAKFLVGGQLNASLIKTGTIQSENGGSWWNLNTGELYIDGSEVEVDKSKIFVTAPTTPYYVGDAWMTGYTPHTAVADIAIANLAVADNSDSGAAGLGSIKICINSRLSGSYNAEDWVLVTDTIDASDIDDLYSRISNITVRLSQDESILEAKADVATVNGLSATLQETRIIVDGYDSTITAAAQYSEQAVATANSKNTTYREEPAPPYKENDLWVTGTEVYTSVADIAIAGGEDDTRLTRNAAVADWGGEIWICLADRSTGSFSWDDWFPAAKYATDADLYAVRQEIRSAEVAIDGANARISLKADATTVTDLQTRVRSAEVEIDGANARITANASSVTSLAGRVSSAEATLVVQANAISSKVSTTDYTGAKVASLINQSASTITIAAEHIALTGANIADRVNSASSSVKISASHIDIEGAVAFSSLDSNVQGKINTAQSTASAAQTAASTAQTAANTAQTAANTAQTAANTAQSTANGAIKSTVSVYYRSTTNSTPSISTSTSIGTAVNTDNAWEYVMPRPSRGKYFYTCERYVTQGGTVSFSAVRALANATYTSMWCHSSDQTCIDGGQIYTNTVTAAQIAAGTITATEIASNAITADKIKASAVTADKIDSGAVTTAKLAAGAVTAAKISVTDLYAIGATIGAFVIDSNSIYSGTKDTGTESGDVTLRGSGTFSRSIGGTSRSSLKLAIGSSFGVNSAGIAYMSNAVITGGSIVVENNGYDVNYIAVKGTTSANNCWLNHRWMGFQYGSKKTFWGTDNSDQFIGFVDGISETYIGASGVGDSSIALGWANKSRTCYVGLDSNYKSYITLQVVNCETVNESSDERLKDIVRELDRAEASETIYSMKPVEYRLIKDGASGRTHHGLKAQDVERVITGTDWGIVGTDTDGFLTLAYSELIADLIATVQKQNERITALEAGL